MLREHISDGIALAGPMDLCPAKSEFPVETQACLHIFLTILVQISSYNYFQYFSLYKILKRTKMKLRARISK